MTPSPPASTPVWLDAAVVAAITAAFASLFVFAAERYLAALERKREKAAAALSNALPGA